MIFPNIVYKKGGHCQCPGGTYSWLSVKSQAELDDALEEGYKPTLNEAMGVVSEDKTPVDVEPVEDKHTPPTRDEMETKARELGIRVTKRMSDDALLKAITEVLAEESEED